MTVKTPAAIIYDPTGTHAAEVKPASTAALATDKALVATLSPNGNQLTDTQLRATPVPVSDGGGSLTVDGSVAVSNFPAVQPVNDNGGSLTVDDGGGSITVDGPLTDAQLRAVAVPVSAASLPLPAGAATAALQTQPGVDIGDVTVNNGAGASAVNVQDGGNSLTVDTSQLPAALVGGRLDVVVGAPLPAGTNNIGDVDVLSVPAPLSTAGGGTEATALRVTIANDSTGVVSVDDNGGSLTVDATSWPLPTGAATQATLVTLLTEADFDARVGNVSPTPTANTILGRLKDLYDRFIAQLPAALVGGRLDTNIGSWLGSTVPTVGQKTKANSIPVAFASDQDAIGIYIGSPANSRTGLVTASSTLGGGTANVENRVTLTPYNEQTTNAIRSVASANANDTAAGTGARTLRIVYYDQNLAGPFTTDVTMNGATAVALSVSNVCFVERMEVLTVGSLGSNAGVITLYVNNTGGGGVIGTIGYGNIVTGIGDNRTFWGHHYISTDYTATLATFVTSADSGGSGTSAEFYFKVRNPTSSISPNIVRSDLLLATGVIVRTLAFPIKIVGPAVAVIYCVPFVNNAHLNASLDFSEVAT